MVTWVDCLIGFWRENGFLVLTTFFYIFESEYNDIIIMIIMIFGIDIEYDNGEWIMI
jgi:hypothetical protein